MSQPDESPRLLPVLVNTTSANIWLTDEQILRLQSHRPSLLSQNWGFALLPLIVFATAFASVGALGPLVFGMVAVSLVTVTILCFLAIKLLDAGRYAKAFSLCNVGLLVGKLTGTCWYAQSVLDQLKAVLFAKQGRLVEAQIAYALWPLSREHSVADTTWANILSRGLRFKDAAELYRNRYDQSKAEKSKAAFATTANNLGFAHLLGGDAGLAREYLTEALSLSSTSRAELRANILVNLGRANVHLNNFAEAEEQLNSVRAMIDTKQGYFGQVLGEVQLGFAELRFLQNDLEQALLYVRSSTEYYQTTGRGEPIRQYALAVHAEILKATGGEQELADVLQKFDDEQRRLVENNELLLERVTQMLETGKVTDVLKLTTSMT